MTPTASNTGHRIELTDEERAALGAALGKEAPPSKGYEEAAQRQRKREDWFSSNVGGDLDKIDAWLDEKLAADEIDEVDAATFRILIALCRDPSATAQQRQKAVTELRKARVELMRELAKTRGTPRDKPLAELLQLVLAAARRKSDAGPMRPVSKVDTEPKPPPAVRGTRVRLVQRNRA